MQTDTFHETGERFFWVRCDVCGLDFDWTEVGWFPDEGIAVDVAIQSEWAVSDAGRHHCPECQRGCVDCGDFSGELERCQPCWLVLANSSA